MIKTLFVSLIAIVHITCIAQVKITAVKELFDEPTEGFGKLLILENRNTVFCSVLSGTLNFKIFNSDHKLIKNISPQTIVFNNKAAYIKAIFEINSDIVLLVMSRDGRIPTLTRIVLNASNGKVKEEKELIRLESERVPHKTSASLAYEYFFFIRKDPKTNHYAIIANSYKSKGTRKQITCIWYGAGHQEIARSAFAVPDTVFDQYVYHDMAFVNDQKLIVLVNGVKKAKQYTRQLYIGVLSKELPQFSISPLHISLRDELPESNNLFVSDALMKFNSVTGKFVIVSNLTDPKKDDGYLPVLSLLSASTLSVESSRIIYPQKAVEASARFFGEKGAFKGLPQDIYIADDGRFDIVFEEKTISMGDLRVSTYLGDLAIMYFDMLGGARGSYFIPKSQYLMGTYLEGFYTSRRELEAPLFVGGNQYKKAMYVNGKQATYMLFNDTEKNGESYKNGRISTINALGECDAFGYRIEGYEAVPSRTPVFGLSREKDRHYLGWFPLSAYDKANNQFVTLRLELNKRQKKVQIVWLEFL